MSNYSEQGENASSSTYPSDDHTAKLPPGTPERNPYQPPSEVSSGPGDESSLDLTRLRKTRIGLWGVYYGICAVLLGVIVGAGVIMVGAMNDSAGLAMVGGLFAVAACLGGFLAILVGQILCLTVPEESGGRRYVLATVTLQLTSFVLPILGLLMMRFMAARINQSGDPRAIETMLLGWQLLNLLQTLVGLAGFLCFVIFMRKLALFVQRHDLQSTASGVLKMTLAAIAMLPIVGVVAYVTTYAGVNGRLATPIVFLVFALFVLVTFIRYVNLIRGLAKAIR